MSAKGSELKRVRQSRKANLKNRHYKSLMKTNIKQVYLEKNRENAQLKAKIASSTVDKVCSKGVIHKNMASRLKSKLMRYVNTL